MNAEGFGKYLRSLRKSKNLTLKELANLSEVSQSYITNVENNKRGIPSPDILKKLSEPLGVDYEELMIKAGYWKKRHTKEDRILFEEIYNTHSDALDQITEVLKALADDDGFFPNYLHNGLFEIFGGWLPRQEDGQWDFDEWFVKFQQRTEDEITDTDVEETHKEFNKIYSYTTVKNGFRQYEGTNKSLDDFLHELLVLANKHDIEINATEPIFTSIELSDILPDQSIIIRFNGKLISPENRYRILGFLDALSIIDNNDQISSEKSE